LRIGGGQRALGIEHGKKPFRPGTMAQPHDTRRGPAVCGRARRQNSGMSS
jgi:hypothetical protein